MAKILNPKLLIPVFVVILLVGFVLYTLLAPETWWKPVYVRLEMDPTPVPAQAAAPAAEPAPAQPTEAAPAGPEEMLNLSPAQTGQGIMYKLDTKVVNLADPGGLRYLQTMIVLEFHPMLDTYYGAGNAEEGDHAAGGDHGEGAEATATGFLATIDARRPVVDDIVMTVLSSKTYNEIATVKGKVALKKELMDKLNEALGYEGIINIYFTEFVVQ